MSQTVSYFDKGLGLSLELPATWETGRSADFPLVLLAPVQQDYRANLGFDQTAMSVPDPARLAEIIAATKRDQLADYPDFKEIEEEQLYIDNRPAYWQRYTWQPTTTPHRYAQVFGLIVIDRDQVLDFHAASLDSLADTFMPTFRRIVESIRFIPH